MARGWGKVVTGSVLLGAASLLGYTVSHLDAMPAGLSLRVETLPLLFHAAYAIVIALFLLLRAGERAGAHELSLGMALMALVLTLAVVPEGPAGRARLVVFGVAWAWMVLQVLYFWTRYPQRLDVGAVAALADRPASGMWYDGPNRLAARVAGWMLGRRAGQALLALSAVGFSWVLVGVRAKPYNLLRPGLPELEGVIFPLSQTGALLVILVTTAVAWTSFRLADERDRRRVLWILWAHVITAIMTSVLFGLQLVVGITGSRPLGVLEAWLNVAFMPVGWGLFLTGYAIGIFYYGALDLRPVIGRSTVYGASLICLTVVFAAVEEIAETLVASRVGIPEGLGTWVGAASIAVLLGPVRDKIAQVLHRLVPELDAKPAASPAAGVARPPLSEKDDDRA